MSNTTLNLAPENQPRDGTLPPIAGASILIQGKGITSLGGSTMSEPDRLSNMSYNLDFSRVNHAGSKATPSLMGPKLPIRTFDAIIAMTDSKSFRVLGGAWINRDNLFDVNPNVLESTTDALGWRIISNSTTNIPAQPSMSTTAPSNHIQWLFGGRRGTSNSPYSDTLIRISVNDPISVQRIDKPSLSAPWPPSRGTGLLIPLNSTHLFLSGGFSDDQSTLSDWWIYSIPSNTWKQGRVNMKTPRAGHRGIVVGSTGRYVMYTGGWGKTPPVPFMELVDTYTGNVYDMSTDGSQSSSTVLTPTVLAQHNMVFIDSQIILFNGFIDSDHLKNDLRHNRQLFVATVESKHQPVTDSPFTITWRDNFLPGFSNGVTDGDLTVNKSNRNGWAIAGWVVGGILLAKLITVAILYVRRRSQQNDQDKPNSHTNDNSSVPSTISPVVSGSNGNILYAPSEMALRDNHTGRPIMNPSYRQSICNDSTTPSLPPSSSQLNDIYVPMSGTPSSIHTDANLRMSYPAEPAMFINNSSTSPHDVTPHGMIPMKGIPYSSPIVQIPTPWPVTRSAIAVNSMSTSESNNNISNHPVGATQSTWTHDNNGPEYLLPPVTEARPVKQLDHITPPLIISSNYNYHHPNNNGDDDAVLYLGGIPISSDKPQ